MAVDGKIEKGDRLYRVQLSNFSGYYDQPVLWQATVVGGGEYYLILTFKRSTPDGAPVSEGQQRILRRVVQGQYWRDPKVAMLDAIRILQLERTQKTRSIEKGLVLERALEGMIQPSRLRT